MGFLDASQPRLVERRARAEVDTPEKFRPFRALVADDNAVNREVASEALSQLGGSVQTVENGLQAIAAESLSQSRAT